MYASNVERAGGARDESEVYINYSREELSAMLRRIENRCRQLAENGEKTVIKRRGSGEEAARMPQLRTSNEPREHRLIRYSAE